MESKNQNVAAGTTEPVHVPVMPREIIDLLAPAAGEVWLDATAGVGGHSLLLADCVGASGKLICLDQDESMLRIAKRRLGDRAVYWHANFDAIKTVLAEINIDRVDGVLADLGFCSDQMIDAGRGLSFQSEGPLDMRLNREDGEPASRLVASLAEKELADLIWRYGEERFSRRIARKIVAQRKTEPIATTTQLAALVRSCLPRPKKGHNAIDPATRVFQALRIAVNDELGALERLLQSLPSCIRPGGRVGIISFHSLEDRLVKQSLRDGDVWDVLTRKPVQPSETEIQKNSRARSAKLRAAQRK